jgi:hypothetical protein
MATKVRTVVHQGHPGDRGGRQRPGGKRGRGHHGASLATAHPCGAKLCKGHVVAWGTLKICPSHGRFVARAK